MTDTPTASTSYPTTGFTSLTDSQLRQTITQITNAGNARDPFQHYVSPAPQAAPAKGNVHTWSTSTGPKTTPRARNRAAKGSTLAPPTQPAHVPPTYQAPVIAAPVIPVAPAVPPNPPRHPLPVTPQALHSTYASRLRTGTTLLVQPILSAPTAATRASRRGGLVNYADPGSGDDIPDAGALDSDDSDFVASGGTRTAIRQTRSRMGTGMTVFQSGSGVSTPQPQIQTARPNEKAELDQSYLGMIPPSKFIRAKPTAPTAHEYPAQDALEAQSRRRTALVPIRVEFETDTHRVRDCFVWNLYETLVKPEAFAKTFCNDLDLPTVWVETIANQIRAQLEEHEGVASMDLGVDAPMETDPNADSGEELPDCRVVLSIDVQISTHHLLDHIEWDLLSPLTPEEFSQQLCNDLGLSGEAIPLVAHAIHEELVKHKKDAIEWGVIGGDREVPEDYASDKPRDKTGLGLVKDKTGLGLGWGRTPKDGRGPKALRSVWRDWPEAEEFRTRFEVLSAEEVERREIERERASRRLRRETSKFQTNTRTRRR
ncbi:SNF5-domain-containing protein [Leucogyrophana mollusca]|uniref:SNF5-domain-containing protein n=1 Tax=Leucogyrophana mollusca TaxID=85980 RepID=A0ACB8BQP9_9AGAM|nr:SNF5-domain-containing protein [Leucogyrophana mollusca]